MTNPYHAMCAELVAAVDLLCGSGYSPGQPVSRLILTVHVEALEELADRARSLLAQRVAEGPTDEGLWELFQGPGTFSPVEYARAVLAHWGHPTPQPVAVSEGPWERNGWCDAEGRCYGWDGDYWWMVGNPGAACETITHWLPANALPTPEATND